LFDPEVNIAEYPNIISGAGQIITPSGLPERKTIGTKPLYFAGTVIKALSVRSDIYKGVYHIKGIDYTTLLNDDYPGIEQDIAVQGYKLFVDDYIAIIRDFLNQSDANTLYLVQVPGNIFADKALSFYNFIFYNIYVILFHSYKGDKTITFNIVFKDENQDKKTVNITIEELKQKANINNIYDIFKIGDDKKPSEAVITGRRQALVETDAGLYYTEILPYITTKIQELVSALPTTDELVEKRLEYFYNNMHEWFDDDMIIKIFQSGSKIVDLEDFLFDLYREDDTPNVKQYKEKLKTVFDRFTKQRGGGNLEDFKQYIREQISKIKIVQ
jgi:hypothetical protein